MESHREQTGWGRRPTRERNAPQEEAHAWGQSGGAAIEGFGEAGRFFPGGPHHVGMQAWGPEQQVAPLRFDPNRALEPPGGYLAFPEAAQTLMRPAFTFPPRGKHGLSPSDPFLHSPSAVSSPAAFEALREGHLAAGNWMPGREAHEWGGVASREPWAQMGGAGEAQNRWPSAMAAPQIWNGVADRPEREQGEAPVCCSHYFPGLTRSPWLLLCWFKGARVAVRAHLVLNCVPRLRFLCI
jgi:hypothetical protein